MALRKRVVAQTPGRPGSVPEQFRSRLHPMWSDPEAIAEFCAEHGIVAGARGPLSAFQAVVEAYAVAQGWVRFYGSNSRPFPDLNAPALRGVPLFSCSLLGLEKHGMLGRDISPKEWDWIAKTEQKHLDELKEN